MKSNRYCFVLSILMASLLCSVSVSARTWTNADGTKTFDGELTSYNAETGDVGVTLANGKKIPTSLFSSP